MGEMMMPGCRALQRTIADLRWQVARQMTEHDVARTTQAAAATAADDSPRLRKYDSASSITLGAIAHQLSISSKEGRLAYDLRSIIQVCEHAPNQTAGGKAAYG